MTDKLISAEERSMESIMGLLKDKYIWPIQPKEDKKLKRKIAATLQRQAAQMEAMRGALVLADKAMRTIAFNQCHDGGKARARAMDAIKTVLDGSTPTQSAADRLVEAIIGEIELDEYSADMKLDSIKAIVEKFLKYGAL